MDSSDDAQIGQWVITPNLNFNDAAYARIRAAVNDVGLDGSGAEKTKTVAPTDPRSSTRVEREWSAQHVDALGGIHRFALPRGVQAGPRGRFEVLRHGKVYEVPSRVWSHLGVATFMALFGLIPLFAARHARKALKRDLERLETLRRADHQIAAIAVRTVQVNSPRRRRHGNTPPPWFRIWATFEHAGHIYEAPSDMQPDDPGPLDPHTIRVHLHPHDPLLSRVLSVPPNTRHGR